MPNLRPKTERSTTADCARIAGLTYEQGEAFIQAILDELARGKEVRLQGLGVFHTAEVKRREVVSPMLPGGRAVVPERDQIRFRRSRRANEAINQTPEERRAEKARKKALHDQQASVLAEGREMMGRKRAGEDLPDAHA